MSDKDIQSLMFNTACVGADDGFDSMKLMVFYQGKTGQIRIPSFIAPGKPSRASLDGSAVDLWGYSTFDEDGNDRFYSVGEEQENIIKTAQDAFVTSPAARVLLHHSIRLILNQVNYNGDDPVVCYTGLPVEKYYAGTARNDRFISKKLANVDTSKSPNNAVTPLDSSLGPMPNIQFINCQPEAVSAWYSYTVGVNDSLSLEPDHSKADKKIVVVDWGGRTIDIIPMHRGQPDLAAKATLTDKGAIYLTDILRQVLFETRDDIPMLDRLDHSVFRAALITGKINVFAHQFDILAEREVALERYRSAISPLIFSILENLTQYTHVLFVGGPVEMILSDDHTLWAPKLMTRIVPSEEGLDPAMMNAEGLALNAIAAANALANKKMASLKADRKAS